MFHYVGSTEEQLEMINNILVEESIRIDRQCNVSWYRIYFFDYFMVFFGDVLSSRHGVRLVFDFSVTSISVTCCCIHQYHCNIPVMSIRNLSGAPSFGSS